MPAAMPCRTGHTKSTLKPVAFWIIARQNTLASLKPTILRESVWKELFIKVMKIAGRGINSLSHNNLVHKYIPMPQAMNIPDAKAAVEKKERN